MRKKFMVPAAVSFMLLLGLTSVAATYARDNAGFGRHRGFMARRLARELNLSDAQRAQIKTIMQAEKPKLQPLMQQLHQSRMTEQAAMGAQFDEAKARAYADQQARLMSDLMVERARIQSQIYSVLTPAQQQKMQQLRQERQQRMQQRLQQQQNAPAAPQNPD